ncbi:MAG: sulfatase family protein [Planctomycetota bacterium]|jgi:arylsulfatase A-like enzyme
MPQPNFLVICLDQISAYSLACNGNAVVKTPNMDRLAREGTNFTRAYCSNPVCMPNRASFITGLTPRQHGLLTNGSFLPWDLPTIGDALIEKGYRTHSVGKLHLQPCGPNTSGDGRESLEARHRWANRELTDLPSPYYGYQTSDFTCGHVNGIQGHYGQWLEDNHPDVVNLWKPENAYHKNGHASRLEVPAELHYNHWIADRTMAFLTRHSREGGNPGINGTQEATDSPNPWIPASAGMTEPPVPEPVEGVEAPFFCFTSFPDPHFPFAATKPYSEMYRPEDVDLPATYGNRSELIPFLRDYRPTFTRNNAPGEDEMREIIAQTYGMITHVDDNIGRILDRLDELGLSETTHVILTADHGEYLGSHDLIHKGTYPYESLYRIPFIWRAPGGSGTDCDLPTATVDFVPTVCELAGIDTEVFMGRGFGESEKLAMPGRSLVVALQGEELPNRPVLLEYDEDCHAGPLIRERGLVDGPYKLIQYYGSDECILVNVDEDPNELTNLWDHPDYREVQSRMVLALSQRLIATERFDNNRAGWA